MTRRNLLKWLLSGMAFLFLGLTAASGSDALARMKDRLPRIDQLKAAGVIGEGNDGMIAARTALTDVQEGLVEAENADRKELYSLVARRSGQSLKEVGKQRAVRIAQQALAGVWLENAKGDWIKKQ